MQKVLLVGDSIIDNDSYVKSSEKSVIDHLQSLAPNKNFLQLAVDGHTTIDVLEHQLEEPTYLPTLLSIGGNDLLTRIRLITDETPRTPVSFLEELHEIASGFRSRYERILEMLTGPVLACTIYNPAFLMDPEIARLQNSAEIVVGIFNDIIQQAARQQNKDILELRSIFTEMNDYANPIEPSHTGGQKLSLALIRWLEA